MSGPSNQEKGTHLETMSSEVLIQIVCKNDETRAYFSQVFFVFYNTEIYKHIQ